MRIEELQQEIIDFRDERNWKQFHQIKDLLLGLNIEVSELSQLFLWKSSQEIDLIEKNKIEEELADIFIFLTYISKHFDIELSKVVKEKIELNNRKYPVSKSYNSNKKYNELG